ncbi:MAG: glycosyltransferase [Planctomycetota bacterium]
MKVLVVAYYFPPKGGAGTQRFAKFCKFLPEHGIEPVVLTVDEAEKSEHAPNDDRSLAAGTSCRVVRVAAPAKAPLSFRIRRKLRLHVDADEWAWAAAERAVQLARAERFDAVITTLSPYACYRVGERLQRELGLPWIADLRDPWALDAWRVYPSPVHAARDLGHLRRTLRTAAATIANVPEARRAFVALGADADRCVTIPNGFDEEDFAAVAPQPRDDDTLRLVHVGTFHPADLAEGFTRNTLRRVRNRQIEPIGRTGAPLLRAVAAYRDRVGAEAAQRQLSVHFYGQVDDSHRALIAQLGLDALVTMHGYVAHRESIAAALAADALFVPLHGVPVGERALVVPGKLYEALASERAILAALPPGDGADLVRGLGAGEVVCPTDVGAIADVLQRWVAARAAGRPPVGCRREALGGFTRRSLTRQLATVIEAVARGAAPGPVVDPWRAAEIA